MEKSCFPIKSQLKIEAQKIQNKALVGDHHLEEGTNEEKIFKCWSKPQISPKKLFKCLIVPNLFLVNMSLILGYG